MDYVYLDYETYSEASLRDGGVYKYATHPTTEILCLVWIYESTPDIHYVWMPSFGVTQELRELYAKVKAKECLLVAHNASFEFNIWNGIQPGAPKITYSDMNCTMSRCNAMNIPASLEKACDYLGLSVQKDMEGSKLMKQMCMPRKPTKKDSRTRINDKESLERLTKYCIDDVKATRALSNAIYDLTPHEREVWIVDQEVNQRGVKIDLQACEAINSMCGKHKEYLASLVPELTNGEVQKPTQNKALTEFMAKLDPRITSLDKLHMTEYQTMKDLPKVVKTLLNIRQQASKTSTSKFVSMINGADLYGSRVRESHLYHKAGTGRWAGRKVQFQNVPKAGKGFDVEEAIEDFKTLEYPNFRAKYDDVLTAASSCLRAMVVSEKGYLRICDYSSIESRVLFWLADCKKGLEIYSGDGKLYEYMASKVFECSVSDIKKPSKERDLGKAIILGCIAEGCKVKTKRGKLPIEEVQLNDIVWDGVKWVKHSGVLKRGKKHVINMRGNLRSTIDHLILRGNMWLTAGEIVLNEDTQPSQKVTDLVTLKPCLTSIKKEVRGLSIFAAYVGLLKAIGSTWFGKARDYSVKDVLKQSLLEIEGRLSIQILSKMLECEDDGLWHFITVENDVRIRKTKTSKTMEVEVLPSTLKQERSSLAILLLSMDGINGRILSIELIPTKDIQRVISDVLRRLPIIETSVSETYDISNCGDEHCFMVDGEIAHNCGYQMGLDKFSSTVSNSGLDIDGDILKKAHKEYRDTFPEVPDLWCNLEACALEAMEYPNNWIDCGKVSFMRKDGTLYCKLPSGRVICYQRAFVKKVFKFGKTMKQISYMTSDLALTDTYGGKLCENVIQAISRDLLAYSLVECHKQGLDVVLHVHDEIVIETDRLDDNSLDLIMTNCKPEWAKDIPIEAEGETVTRYKK